MADLSRLTSIVAPSVAKQTSATQKYSLLSNISTDPKFLHERYTSHKSAFGAIAALIDNAANPDVMATKVWIDAEEENGLPRICFTDNGCGMERDVLAKMLIGNEKEEFKGHLPRHFTNGFIAASMRLGQDALVFTRSKTTFSVGMLSQTFLLTENATAVLVPMVTWDFTGKCLTEHKLAGQCLTAIETYSPFKSIHEIMNIFKKIPNSTKNGTGTHIVIYNLKVVAELNALELDFYSDIRDIRLTPTQSAARNEISSLRAYCFLIPKRTVMVYLRGTKVLPQPKETVSIGSAFGALQHNSRVSVNPVLPPTATKFVENSDWDGLSKFLQQNCRHRIIADIYPNNVNLNTKTVVDKLAIKSLENLLIESQQRSVLLQQQLDQNTIVIKGLLNKRDELRQQLTKVEAQISLVDNEVQKQSKELTEARSAHENLDKNVLNYRTAFKRNEAVLNVWLQKLQTDLKTWTNEDVLFLLKEIGMSQYSNVFLKNKIDGAVLQQLETNDFMSGLGVSFKDAKKLLMYIYMIQSHQDIYSMPAGVLQWNNETVCTWLEDNKFGHLVDVFKNHKITGADLVFLEKADLLDQLQIKTIIDVIKLQKEILVLKESILSQSAYNQNNGNNNNIMNDRALELKLAELERFNEELKIAHKERETKVPEAYLCPITQDLMNDPVFASDGYTYERTAIELWLKNNDTSPMTGLQLFNKQLTPSHTLKSMICEFIDANKKN